MIEGNSGRDEGIPKRKKIKLERAQSRPKKKIAAKTNRQREGQRESGPRAGRTKEQT